MANNIALIQENQLIIRPFQSRDQSEVKSLILSGLEEHFGPLDPTLNQDLVDIDKSYISHGAVFLVAEAETRIVATGALIFETKVEGRLVRISVHPNYRRRGIGHSMIDELITAGKRANLGKIYVETNREWPAAKYLYEKAGFKEYRADAGLIHYSLMLAA